MTKSELVAAHRAHLAEQLAALEATAGGARDGTRVDGSHRPANRGERAAVTTQGYLAHGLTQRITELAEALRILDGIDLGPRDRVTPGAVVHTVDDEDVERTYAVLPGGRGDRVGDVLVVSAASPVARALLGKARGDVGVLKRRDSDVELEIRSVS